MTNYVQTVIVGGGQAGLAVSYYLTQQDRPHIVLEQSDKPANAWRNHRWDSFSLNTPNWQSTLPGANVPGSGPDGFLSREEIVSYFDDYVTKFQLPVIYGVQVQSVRPQPKGRGYVLETSAGIYEADNVVIAIGLYQRPKKPAFSANLPSNIKQLHSDEYRNPQSLSDGAVLVVGSGQSGAQIAEELYRSGKKVYLSVSRAGRVPRRYRGKDTNWWHDRMGDYERTVDQLASPADKFASKPMISGTEGGHTLNLHQFARDGVTLLGHVQGVRDGKVHLAPDLLENLVRGDRFEVDFVNKVDAFIAQTGIDAHEEQLPVLKDGYDLEQLPELDLQLANIKTVIWATGYSFDFGMVKVPIFDRDGYPIQNRGVSDHPGLYFVGLPWLHNAKSGLLFGLSQDAAHIAAAIEDDARRCISMRRSSRETVVKHDPEFAGKVALVTGGTSGIGAATAKRLSDLGAKIVITGRRLSEGRKLISEIRHRGGCAAFLQTDLRDEDQVRLVVPYTIETFGRLDFAFNNAATPGQNRLLADQTEENFDDVFAVNVKALFILLKAEIKQMVAQGRGGSIVNSSSISGFVSTPKAGVYGASKSAVLGLTKTAAVEYGNNGIRVNAVSPGAVRTQMLLDIFKSEEVLQRMGTHHPLGRIGRPEEVADAVVWLFSDRSSYYSGQSLTLDGGLTALRPSIEQSPVESEGQSLRRISSSPELPMGRMAS